MLNAERVIGRAFPNILARTKIKHGNCRHIPKDHRGKEILSCIRNPFELYASEYEFGWWKRPEYPAYFRRLIPGFKSKYPHFPDLSFSEFVRVYNQAFCIRPSSRNFDNPDGIGFLSERFIKFYCHSPFWKLMTIRNKKDIHISVQKSMHEVTFIHTESLNVELQEYLSQLDYDEASINFISEKRRVLPGGKGRDKKSSWHDYFTPELRQHIQQRERLLFALFPEYNFQSEQKVPELAQ